MTDLLTALSILVAAFTWFLTQRWDRAARRVAYTADVLANLSTSDRLAESSFEVTKLINSNARPALANVDRKTESHIVDILDYYEFLSDLCAGGVINRETLVVLRGRLMRRTWDTCEEYITETRAVQKRRVYSGFEGFIKGLELAD